MIIDRDIKTSILDTLLNDHKVVTIYGPRQVGKTTLAKEIIAATDMTIMTINGDRRDQHDIISSRDLGRMRSLLNDTQLLFIDEAQNIPEVGLNIKILHDELPDLKIIITGSSSLDLADKTQESLTGRTDTFMLYPISIGELCKSTSPVEVDNRLDRLMIYGMYPEIIKAETVSKKVKRLKELTTSYLYKDILTLSNIKYSIKLQKLVQLLSYQIGQLISIQEISKALQISQDTVVNYIDKLEKAFVVYRLSSLSKNPRKEISKRDKIYFYDLGVRNAVINNFSDISLRNDKGHIWENFMLSERLKYNNIRGYYGNLYFWRTYGGAEIDLIEQYDNSLDGYEFKFSTKKPRPPKSWMAYEQSSYKQINRDNYLKFVM